jgi:hypothetical protein
MPIIYQGEDAVLGWMYDISKLKQTEEFLELAKRSAETSREELLKLHESNMDDLAVANNIMNHIMRSEGLRDPEIRYFQRPAVQFSGDVIAAARDANGDLRPSKRGGYPPHSSQTPPCGTTAVGSSG